VVRRNSEGVATALRAATQPLQGFRLLKNCIHHPRVPERNPGLELANTFGVTILYTRVSGGWRCVIFFRRRPEQFREDRL